MRKLGNRSAHIGFFWLSASITAALFIALSSGTAFAESRGQMVGQLKDWARVTRQRADLDDYERDLRVQLIHRLIFQTERKFTDGSWGVFLKSHLQDISEVEEEPSRCFLLGLLESLETLLEPREDSFRFVQSYFEFSGVQKPTTLGEFEASRQYSNGVSVQSANPMDLEEASDYLDSVLEMEISDKEKKQPEVKSEVKPNPKNSNPTLSSPEVPEPLEDEILQLERNDFTPLLEEKSSLVF